MRFGYPQTTGPTASDNYDHRDSKHPRPTLHPHHHNVPFINMHLMNGGLATLPLTTVSNNPTPLGLPFPLGAQMPFAPSVEYQQTSQYYQNWPNHDGFNDQQPNFFFTPTVFPVGFQLDGGDTNGGMACPAESPLIAMESMHVEGVYNRIMEDRAFEKKSIQNASVVDVSRVPSPLENGYSNQSIPATTTTAYGDQLCSNEEISTTLLQFQSFNSSSARYADEGFRSFSNGNDVSDVEEVEMETSSQRSNRDDTMDLNTRRCDDQALNIDGQKPNGKRSSRASGNHYERTKGRSKRRRSRKDKSSKLYSPACDKLDEVSNLETAIDISLPSKVSPVDDLLDAPYSPGQLFSDDEKASQPANDDDQLLPAPRVTRLDSAEIRKRIDEWIDSCDKCKMTLIPASVESDDLMPLVDLPPLELSRTEDKTFFGRPRVDTPIRIPLHCRYDVAQKSGVNQDPRFSWYSSRLKIKIKAIISQRWAQLHNGKIDGEHIDLVMTQLVEKRSEKRYWPRVILFINGRNEDSNELANLIVITPTLSDLLNIECSELVTEIPLEPVSGYTDTHVDRRKQRGHSYCYQNNRHLSVLQY